MATLLVLSVVNVSVPVLADQAPSNEPPSTASIATAATSKPVASLADQASRRLRDAIAHPAVNDERHLALEGQGPAVPETSKHWCAGGLGLLAAGVAAAVVSGARRDPNPQKPSPPVGVVLGTAAAAVGGVQMLRACKR